MVLRETGTWTGRQSSFASLFFSSGAIKISDADWQLITGQDEAETCTQIPGGRDLVGSAFGGQLAMAQSGSRADCLLSPKQQDGAMPSTNYFPQVGPWAETIDNFSKTTIRWLNTLQFPITRIAIGSVLVCKAANRDRTFELLANLLKSVSVTPKMQDFLFRVNWPRQSTAIPGLTINRLTTWSSAKVSISTVVLTAGNEAKFDHGTTTDVVRLELDHNTSPEWEKQFDASSVVPLYEELIGLAIENAEKGEVF